jgi:ADP-ribosyl-[dinitrogen reductase] hydrolase
MSDVERSGGETGRVASRYTGCLLGGAVGDALGAAVEFDGLAAIRARFGPRGIRDYAPAYGRLGALTDDTQMTLFSAEGLLRADNTRRAQGDGEVAEAVYHAYLRWLETQNGRPRYPKAAARSGWLLGLSALNASRAPGNTCLSALQSGRMGTLATPLNDSKGCGGVMRAAPAGLVRARDPFRLGCEVAAITHSHPSGYLAAGFLAALVAALVDGAGLEEAIAGARAELRRYEGHEECLAAVDEALRLAREAAPVAESVARLGQGWVAEEALAISLFCATAAEGFEEAVALAVNHDGDSDSTGAITGTILGARLGQEAIPPRWLEPLELRTEIEEVALDLHRHFAAPGYEPDARDLEKYPPY